MSHRASSRTQLRIFDKLRVVPAMKTYRPKVMIKRFKKSCHLKRPRLFGQNVIDSQIGGKMIDNAVDATAPTEEKKQRSIFDNQCSVALIYPMRSLDQY